MGKKNILSIILLFLLAGYGYAQWQPPVNLGENINTLVADNSCSISSDGNSLYFASFRTGGLGSADIWISEKDAGIWQGPVNLGDSINSSGLDFTPHISSDGNHLYFMSTISGGEGGFDIWVSEKILGVWQSPTNLGDSINTSSNDWAPCLSTDGQTLYFASSRPDGYGDWDLWVSEKVGGVWQGAVNLGPIINTTEDETDPAISYDGTRLYFGSDRSGGYGGKDIWFSRLVGSEWQPPINVGSEINSDETDQFPSISSDNLNLYFSTYNRPGGYGNFDIWMSEYRGTFTITGTVGLSDNPPDSSGTIVA